MTIESAMDAIPNGWRMHMVDMSVDGRVAAMLTHTRHGDVVHGVAATLETAIEVASGKARNNYRGWQISPAYIGYSGTHPDFDADLVDGEWVGNGLCVHGMTIEEVKSEIDDREDEE